MDIIMGIDSETTAQKLFDALTTDQGIAAWWSPQDLPSDWKGTRVLFELSDGTTPRQ